MTENPAQGASPENREPATPNEGESGRPQAAPAPDSPQDTRRSGHSAGQPAGESDPPAGPGRGQPAAAGLPAAPAVLRPPPGAGDAAVRRPAGARAPGPARRASPTRRHTPGYGQATSNTALRAAPAAAAPSTGLSSTASLLSARPSTASFGRQPVRFARMRPTRPTPRSARPPSASRPSWPASGRRPVGGGVVAGDHALLGDRSFTSTGSSNSSQAGPVIVNNREDVNAITAAAREGLAQRRDHQGLQRQRGRHRLRHHPRR